MKKLTSAFICLILTIPCVAEIDIVDIPLTIITNNNANNPPVATGFVQLDIIPDKAGGAIFVCDDVQWLNLAGEPAIPWKAMTVLLPPDVDLASVSANMSNSKYESNTGTWEVSPTLPPVTWKDGKQIVIWPEGKRIVDGYDLDIYERDAFWPEAEVRLLCTGQLRKYLLAQIAIPLVKHNPVSGELIKLAAADVTVTFDRKVMTVAMSRALKQPNKIGRTRVQKLAVNYKQMIDTYEAAVSGSGGELMSIENGGGEPNAGYTIITTSAIKANSTKLYDFVAHKESLGFDVQVITETDFGGGTGDIASENIRQWLQDNYVSDNIEYVLLVGNPDTDIGEIPMKMLWPNSVSIYKSPSDYYYADLTGNWDLDGDGNFGEWNGDSGIGGIDRYWEVLVGRIPYYGSISDLDAILQKTIDYEYETNYGTTEWRKNVLLPMKPADEFTLSYHLGEQIKNDVLVPVNWLYHRVYDEDYGLVPPPETTPCTYDNVTAVWNGDANNSNGRFGLVVWSTHGNESIASHVMDISHVPDLNDNYPSFTFQCSCKNSYPEVSTNLSYELLKNGGICTIGATRESWYASGKTEYEGTSYSEGLGYEYSSRVAIGWTSGQALYNLKQLLWPGGNWMNFTVFNIYGDPALNITNEKSSEKYYVDKDATGGSNDGSSWTNAFTELQLALLEALPGDEIWVAQGTYLPGTQRTDSFKLVAEVEVYGGYAGLGEIDPNARDIETYETTLSGDIGTPDEPCDNCYHVVVGALDAVLDGFTITGGNANGEPDWSSKEHGGGMYCPTSMVVSNCKFIQNNAEKMGGAILLKQNMRLFNCIFSNNTAIYGGGLCNVGADITVINCTFNGNYASTGGGVRISNSIGSILDGCTFSGNSAGSSNAGGGLTANGSNPTVTNCTFIGNYSGYAGAMITWGGYPTVINCEFIGNWTTSIYRGGGAIYNRENNPNIRNCRFVDNSSNRDGGAVNNHNSNYTITNCVFSGNSASGFGGAVCDVYKCNSVLTNCTITANTASNGRALACDSDEQQYPSEIQVTNCIIWDGGNEIWNNDGSTINVTYSNVKGGWPGEGNINADPCFADSCGGDYHLQSIAGRWDPNSEIWVIDGFTSPCIDAGNPGYPLNEEPIDTNNVRINMGAFGGTDEASKSPANWSLLADLTNDGLVNLTDYAYQADDWLNSADQQPGDLNRDSLINISDLSLLIEDWLEQTTWY